jgi:hypothetical protein
MQNITVNALHKEFVPLPSVESDAVLILTIIKASGGTLSGGTFTFVTGKEWLLTFTPATLNETYGVVVTDAEGDLVFSGSYKALGTVWDATTGPTGTIVVGTNSWVTGQEAEDYFATRFGVGTNWSALSDVNKIASLISAYRQLIGCGDYDLPTAVVDITQAMEDAQCEMALFLIIHQTDMDARMGLQAQGVSQAGIVQETYKEIDGIPMPSIVKILLKDYESASPIHVINLEREEDEDAL